jgi:hypothetical protein
MRVVYLGLHPSSKRGTEKEYNAKTPLVFGFAVSNHGGAASRGGTCRRRSFHIVNFLQQGRRGPDERPGSRDGHPQR